MKHWFLALLFSFAPLATASDSIFQDFSGNAAQIEDYAGKGKWLLVMYWAADCHVCNVEAHSYVDFHARHHTTDASVLGISLDGQANRKAAEAFIARHEVSFPNLIGEPDLVALHYSTLVGETWFGTPTFLLYDPEGTLFAMQVGAIPVEMIEGFIARNSAPPPETR
jgi:peroxiredoxin